MGRVTTGQCGPTRRCRCRKPMGRGLSPTCRRLAEFGRYKTGVHRPTYSPEDVASRQWLAEKFAEAGLDPVIDGIGNVFGHNRRAARTLLVGSHSETQPRGGWLDGALGVIYALEAARALTADPSLDGVGVEPVAWADEEGHYGNMLGSRSFTGTLERRRDRPRHEPRRQKAAPTRSPKPAMPAGQRDRLRAGSAISAISRRISSRAARSRRPESASASSRRSSATGTTGSPSPASRTMPARPRCTAARTPPPRWCASPRASTTALPKSPGTAQFAHGLDDRPHPDRPERAEHRPRPRRDAGAVPRHRHRHPGALRAGIARAGRRGRPRRPLRRRDRADLEKRAGPDGPGFQREIESSGRASRAGPAHADAERRRPRRADPGRAGCARRCCSCRASSGVSHHWSENTSEADIMLGAQVFADAAAAILKAG